MRLYHSPRLGSVLGLAIAVATSVATPAVYAADYAMERSYQPAPQTILNRDGGPWAHLDLMTMSVEQLQSHIQSYTVDGQPFNVGPMRLIHTYICLNPVGIDYNSCSATNPNPKPISAEDVQKIDDALAKAVQARVKIVLRFAYNHGPGDDAPLDVILQDIQSLAPLVQKYKPIIYAMNQGFIGFWGEGHDSTYGNNTQSNMQQIMQAEQRAFGDATFMLNRQPANILSWELGSTPYWGIHDDHYATGDDAGTWISHPWDNGKWTADELKSFAAQRSDIIPFSGEVGGLDPATQNCAAFDAYSTRLHLNMINIGFHMDFLSSQSCYPSLMNKVGPAISLVRASLDRPFLQGSTSTLTLAFRNTGYSRLFSAKPMYFVLVDADGNAVDSSIFTPVPISYDLRQLAALNGQGSTSVEIAMPRTVHSGSRYQGALWIPDADEQLARMPEYNYLLNNVGVPNPRTGLNILFPMNF
ncbi:DUF4874 domain-containing protein [Paludibaculum fermentans]|uniref:DUF4874 domain-containing protein n=1 Tax=Paludibaculum fermentans TaxID=1473598 RepID=UPI003EBBECFD